MIAGLVRSIDVVICLICAFIAFYIYLYGRETVSYSIYYLLIGLAVFVQVSTFHVAGIYHIDTLRNTQYQLSRIWLAWTCVFAVLIVVLFISKSSSAYSRGWMIIWYLTGLVAFATVRVSLIQYLRHGIRNGTLRQRVIVVGGGAHGSDLIRELHSVGAHEIEVLGFFDDRAERVPEEIDGCRKLGRFEDIFQFAREKRIDLVVLALPVGDGKRVYELLKALWVLPVDICVSAGAAGIQYSPDIYKYIENVPLLSVFKKPINDWDYVVKTIEDKVVASLMLLFSLPLLILIAIAIKLDSPGPVIFKQYRYGFNHELFKVWKFRTMYEHLEDPDCATQTTRADFRVTRLGKFLRRTSLDELPQLINVLKGDMSIVGPRPHALATKSEGQLISEVVDKYAARHKVKPGITGWAQVNGWRGETDTAEKVQGRVDCDLYYIENWSLWFDIFIMLKSASVIFHDTHAY